MNKDMSPACYYNGYWDNQKSWEKDFLYHDKEDWDTTCSWVKTLEYANELLEIGFNNCLFRIRMLERQIELMNTNRSICRLNKP